ncbi:MAG TPA: hypothetical protein DCX46_10545 [Bacteroidetes bacterium]|nr:hypothetical protein [Bacteroidota bacterium]
MAGQIRYGNSFCIRWTVSLLAVHLLLASRPSLTVAQTPTLIRGTVIDAESRRPIPIVNVIVLNTPFGAATDSAGYFELRHLSPDLYVLEFRHVAYRKRIHVLPLKASQQITFSIELREEPVKLEGVDVISDSIQTRKLKSAYAGTIITTAHIERSGARKLSEILQAFEPSAITNPLARRRRLFPISSWVPYLIYLDGAYVQSLPGSLDDIVDVRQIEKIEISRWVGAAPNFGPGTSDRVILITTKKQR